MHGSKKARRIFAAIVIALLAAGAAQTAFAENAPVSERDALTQAVALYEKMQTETIDVPQMLIDTGYDEDFVKSVVMGFVNLDEYEVTSYSEYISKQDFMNILYKTIITYNPDFIIDEAEAEQILNDCYDNAYIDEENRIAYAFMIKEGFITDMINSEPNAELTWNGCSILVDQIFNLFVSDEAVTVNEATVRVGENISAVTSVLGSPNRIDESDYGFDWYVYNSLDSGLLMIGTDGDRICSFFTNSADFTYKDIKSGDDFAKASKYATAKLRVLADYNGKVDAVMYNPRQKETNASAASKQSRAAELLDMINANRLKNGKTVFYENQALNSEAFLTSIGSVDEYSESKTDFETAYDIFSIYYHLVRDNHTLISGGNAISNAIGIDVSVDLSDDFNVTATLVTNDKTVAGINMAEYTPVESEFITEELNELSEVTTPIIVSPTVETAFDGTEDITVELAMQASTQYHIEVFDYENDSYAVNKYVTTDETSFTLPAELFTAGRDYTVIVSALCEDGTALASEPLLISYGAQYENGVTILSPVTNETTDNDCIAVRWESDIYSDFYVDLYKAGDGLVVSEIVENENEVIIRGADPGEYYLYITALRRGTVIEKAQDSVKFKITQPKPVINEIILDRDDIYDFVYEDEALGVLYFYDEDIVEVEENGETVKKKKIIQKQVRATKAYRRLAGCMTKKASTTGAPFISSGASTKTGNAIVAEAEKYLGVPYVWGGSSPDGFDCSGLVQYVCSSVGIDISRVAEDQFRNGVSVNRDELMPGDLLFFEKNGYIHHVGIYAGDNMMIHAPHTGDVVKYTSIDSDYYAGEYAGARRVY